MSVFPVPVTKHIGMSLTHKPVRVRFAPSPTGGLHLGGVRTVLYNYLYARKLGGTFILRIEDTDQNRYVEGAEKYIYDCLQWCGLEPDESPAKPGNTGPYRQSERKARYAEYAQQLIARGQAYYAFDTPEELERMREQRKSPENPVPQYDARVRRSMRNSLTLPPAETERLLKEGTPFVVRILVPENEELRFHDLIHQEVRFDLNLIDDKVLLKADGMPTYHLAVVVDDYLMGITHAFRGEEWLSSAPIHILLWKYLFGLDHMPQWAHLPLILGPEGKLSKRDGSKYGFPVYAMNWTDPRSGEFTEGFREKGFLPEAFINMLALMGWNSGTEKELFTLEELTEAFSIERVHKAGAHFSYEKAVWFNHEWIKFSTAGRLKDPVRHILTSASIPCTDDNRLLQVIELVKERCPLLTDFREQAGYFFKTPDVPEISAFSGKWDSVRFSFFTEWAARIRSSAEWSSAIAEQLFRTLAQEQQIKPGDVQLPLRLILVGGKFGPAVFDIAGLLGKEETLHRIHRTLSTLNPSI